MYRWKNKTKCQRLLPHKVESKGQHLGWLLCALANYIAFRVPRGKQHQIRSVHHSFWSSPILLSPYDTYPLTLRNTYRLHSPLRLSLESTQPFELYLNGVRLCVHVLFLFFKTTFLRFTQVLMHFILCRFTPTPSHPRAGGITEAEPLPGPARPWVPPLYHRSERVPCW